MKPKNAISSLYHFHQYNKILNLPPENYEGKWLSLEILLLMIFKGKNPEITLKEWNSS